MFAKQLLLLLEKLEKTTDNEKLEHDLAKLVGNILKSEGLAIEKLNGEFWRYERRENEIAGISVGTLQQRRSKAPITCNSYDARLDLKGSLSIKSNIDGQSRTFYFVPSIQERPQL